MKNDGILTRVNDLVAKYSEGKPSGRRYLIKDELDKLEKAKFTSESLSKVRDLAVVQAYTGLAFSDFMKTDF